MRDTLASPAFSMPGADYRSATTYINWAGSEPQDGAFDTKTIRTVGFFLRGAPPFFLAALLCVARRSCALRLHRRFVAGHTWDFHCTVCFKIVPWYKLNISAPGNGSKCLACGVFLKQM